MTRCTILCVHTIDGCKFPPFLDSSVELSKIRKARPLIFKIYWAPIYEVRARKNVSACCTGMTFPISGKSFPIPGLVEGYSWCGKRWLAMYKRSYVSSLLADKVFDASRRRLVQGPHHVQCSCIDKFPVCISRMRRSCTPKRIPQRVSGSCTNQLHASGEGSD